jgi:hypothetical protein
MPNNYVIKSNQQKQKGLINMANKNTNNNNSNGNSRYGHQYSYY